MEKFTVALSVHNETQDLFSKRLLRLGGFNSYRCVCVVCVCLHYVCVCVYITRLYACVCARARVRVRVCVCVCASTLRLCALVTCQKEIWLSRLE